ncbi:protein rogdi [Cloeon dipterum]|uniref:Protein rogdi n=2 Tax=Cloeon dipterum TaxID=197152 RepID=A0A8S1DLK0_9INSE|nr:Hypothetical predicted protein [Cloeon dipterum]
MADLEKEESHNLHVEFQWVLHHEVHNILQQLLSILEECHRRFPLINSETTQPLKQEKFLMSPSHLTTQDQVKCVATLTGDSICHAEIQLKSRRQQNVVHRTSVTSDCPWKLQQVQDAANHLQQAIRMIENVHDDYKFKSSEEVLHLLGAILSCVQRSRTILLVPRKRSMDDLINSKNMKSLLPPLPNEIAVSFYIQSHKLIFAVYQVSMVHGALKFDTSQAECSIPWLNEVLVLLTVGLQTCQQLKDKICVFAQYRDFYATSRAGSVAT